MPKSLDLTGMEEIELPENPIPEDPTKTEGETFEMKTIEAGGIIRDDEGNEWVIPAESLDDLSELTSVNPFKGLEYDPRFEYITEHESKVSMRMTEGFKPVTRREVKMPPLFNVDGAKPQTEIVHIMDTVMMKCPKVLTARRRKAKLALVNEQLQALEPTAEMLASAKRRASSPVRDTGRTRSRMNDEGVPVTVEHTRTIGPEPRGQ